MDILCTQITAMVGHPSFNQSFGGLKEPCSPLPHIAEEQHTGHASRESAVRQRRVKPDQGMLAPLAAYGIAHGLPVPCRRAEPTLAKPVLLDFLGGGFGNLRQVLKVA